MSPKCCVWLMMLSTMHCQWECQESWSSPALWLMWTDSSVVDLGLWNQVHYHSLPPFVSFTWRNWLSLGCSINSWFPAHATFGYATFNVPSNFYARMQMAFLAIRAGAWRHELLAIHWSGQKERSYGMSPSMYAPESANRKYHCFVPYRLPSIAVEVNLCEVPTQTAPIRQRTQLLCHHNNRTRSTWRNLGKKLILLSKLT